SEMARELAAALNGSTSTTQLKVPALVRQPKRRLAAGVITALIVILVLALVLTRTMPSSAQPPDIRAGVRGNIDTAVPTGDEISRASARMGADGFIAYLSCSTSAQFVDAMTRQMEISAAGYGLGFRVYNAQMDRYSQAAQIEQARLEGAKAL